MPKLFCLNGEKKIENMLYSAYEFNDYNDDDDDHDDANFFTKIGLSSDDNH